MLTHKFVPVPTSYRWMKLKEKIVEHKENWYTFYYASFNVLLILQKKI